MAEFNSILWVIILQGYKSLSQRLDHVILKYAFIASLIQFSLLLVQIPDVAIDKSPHPLTKEHLPYALQLVWYMNANLSTALAAHRTSGVIEIFRTLICQSKRLYSITRLPSICVPSPTCDFCFVSLINVSWQQFFYISQPDRVFFQDISSVALWCLELSALCHARWWLWWNCQLPLLLLLVYKVTLFSCFVPFSDVK